MTGKNAISKADPINPAVPPRRQDPEELKLRARQLDAPPCYESHNHVAVRGEALSDVSWQGRQWAVTDYGIECRRGTYAISKDRLWEDEDTHGWIMHLREKNWVDLPDFAEALRLARQRYDRRVDCNLAANKWRR